jgi:hypothetical protein
VTAVRTPAAAELLEAWERGLYATQVDRGLLFLGLACPQASRDALTDLTIGERDSRLVSLREAMFGPDMTALVSCPSCADTLELSFATGDLHADAPAHTPAHVPAATALRHDGYDLQLRLLTSRDLAAAGEGDLTRQRRILLERCIVSAALNGDPVSAAQLPASVADVAVQRVADADAKADTQLAVSCANCGHAWRAPFDIVSYVWTELEAWAARTMREVHILASRYGWSERHILALTPFRRQQYVNMVRTWPTS